MKEEMCTQTAQLCMLMMARHISKQANFLWCFKFCMIDFSFENWAFVPRVLVVWATKTILQAKNLVLLASLLCAYVVVAKKKSCKASNQCWIFFNWCQFIVIEVVFCFVSRSGCKVLYGIIYFVVLCLHENSFVFW
jgi:hypothetical protein